MNIVNQNRWHKMNDPSKEYQKLIEENALLKQRIQKLEKSVESGKTGKLTEQSDRKFEAIFQCSPDVITITDLTSGLLLDVTFPPETDPFSNRVLPDNRERRKGGTLDERKAIYTGTNYQDYQRVRNGRQKHRYLPEVRDIRADVLSVEEQIRRHGSKRRHAVEGSRG